MGLLAGDAPEGHDSYERGYHHNEHSQNYKWAAAAIAGIPAFAAKALAARLTVAAAQRFVRRMAKISCGHRLQPPSRLC